MVPAITIEALGERAAGPCDCCRNETHRVWGQASADGHIVAVYYVTWTPGRVADGASFELILGKWGDAAGAADRSAVALSYRLLENGPAFMVVDAAGRHVAGSSLVGRALSRSEVVGTPVAELVFAVTYAMLAEDHRFAEIRGGWVMRQERPPPP
jgi:hypothetical protein